MQAPETTADAPPLALYTSLTSPFGRKVRMAALCARLGHRIQVVPVDVAQAGESFWRINPLGKIPVLVLPDGRSVYDSRVIVEYLDTLAGNAILLPRDPDARLDVLCGQALADGLLDAAILQVYETRYRTPEQHSDAWLARQRGKVRQALEHAQSRVANVTPSGAPHIADITLAVALGFLDHRLALPWRAEFPLLSEWLHRFEAACPAFAATAP